MTDAERRTAIRDIVRQFAAEAREPEPTESLFDSGLIDSFVLPQLVTALEEAFHIRIPDSDLNPRQFESLARIEAYLSTRAE
ncbi:MAG: acyl carrier protein [Acidobacteriia bacterium]|nr:acyl carrier protein [Terriglobia bacterium]